MFRYKDLQFIPSCFDDRPNPLVRARFTNEYGEWSIIKGGFINKIEIMFPQTGDVQSGLNPNQVEMIINQGLSEFSPRL